jgi:large subunit ribosomal protein L13
MTQATKTKKTPAAMASNKASKSVSKTAKRVTKALKTAKKSASKTQVRTSRSTVRAAARKTEKGTSASRWKVKQPGSAPQSSRITAPKGPVKSLASKTQFAPKGNTDRNWLLVDASNQTVGRLASQIAMLLRGKHKASFTPNNDVGDFVVVINAEKVKFTAKKEEQKRYYKHTGFIGGIKETSPARLRNTHPERILEKAVRGMITRSPLGRAQMTKLKIYRGSEHPHAAQNPVMWKLRYNSAIGED